MAGYPTTHEWLFNDLKRGIARAVPLAGSRRIGSERPLLLSRPLDPAKAEASAALDDFISIDVEVPVADEAAYGAAAVIQGAPAGGGGASADSERTAAEDKPA